MIAVPRAEREHVVLDMAMSQFSYGALEAIAARRTLPVPGGFDAEGRLTRDPAAIERRSGCCPSATGRARGWLLFDMLAAMTSLGNATHQIANDSLRETALSQMFVAIDARALGDGARMEQIADEVVESLHRSRAAEASRPVRYPGENTLRLREENRRLGLPIEEAVWREICGM